MTPKFIITTVTYACTDVYVSIYTPHTHDFYIRRPRTDRMVHALSKLRQRDILIPDVWGNVMRICLKKRKEGKGEERGEEEKGGKDERK